MYNAAEAKMVYGRKLTELFNRHRVVHSEIIERDEHGRFKSMHYVVGGPQ
jgi:hypothetical protein